MTKWPISNRVVTDQWSQSLSFPKNTLQYVPVERLECYVISRGFKGDLLNCSDPSLLKHVVYLKITLVCSRLSSRVLCRLKGFHGARRRVALEPLEEEAADTEPWFELVWWVSGDCVVQKNWVNWIVYSLNSKQAFKIY